MENKTNPYLTWKKLTNLPPLSGEKFNFGVFAIVAAGEDRRQKIALGSARGKDGSNRPLLATRDR